MGALMAFRVGQEVVYISDDDWFNAYTGDPVPGPNPIKNEVYHYAGTHYSTLCGADYIFLDEFGGANGPAFEASFFRPIVKTDISIFEAMLAPSPKQRVDT